MRFLKGTTPVEAFDIGGVVTCQQQHSFDGNFFLCPRLVYSALYTLWQKINLVQTNYEMEAFEDRILIRGSIFHKKILISNLKHVSNPKS